MKYPYLLFVFFFFTRWFEQKYCSMGLWVFPSEKKKHQTKPCICPLSITRHPTSLALCNNCPQNEPPSACEPLMLQYSSVCFSRGNTVCYTNTAKRTLLWHRRKLRSRQASQPNCHHSLITLYFNPLKRYQQSNLYIQLPSELKSSVRSVAAFLAAFPLLVQSIL